MFVDQTAYAFGLLFAGSEGATGVTIYNPASKVAELLEIDFRLAG